MTHRTVELLTSFAAGAASALVVWKLLQKSTPKDRKHAGATVEGNDLSLFYGDTDQLTTITESQRFLPSELYGDMVRDCVVCCCDIILVRYNATTRRKECVLVERSTEPVKGVWWWPGGRILKGETFFAAAIRKAKQETGIEDVEPIQVLGIWNTFFPTSHWDTDEKKGTQTVNAVVLVEITKDGAKIKLDNTSEQCRWIGLNPDEALRTGEDNYVYENLYRLQAWKPAYI